MPTKEELYEIYRGALEGTKPMEELKPSTWNMLKAMWYIQNIKEICENERKNNCEDKRTAERK